jgi:hypothetical protein
MITGLNSPLPGIKIQSFRDLLCDRSLFETKNQQDFNITQWIETSKINWFWDKVRYYRVNVNESIMHPYEAKDCFRIWSPSSEGITWTDVKLPVNQLFGKFNTYTYELQTMMELSQEGTKPGLLHYSDKIMLSLLHPGHAREPQEITKIRIQEKRFPTMDELSVADLEITNCEHKSAYITNSDQLATEMDFLLQKYEKKQFYSGKDDVILKQMEGIRFPVIHKTKIPNLYRWMIDSGIYDRLEVEKVGRKNKWRKPLVKIKKEKEGLEGISSLEGGLITLFMLCGCLISLAMASFTFLECRHIIWKLLVKCCVHSSLAFKKCWIKVAKLTIRKRKKVSKICHHQKMFRKPKHYTTKLMY